MVMCCRNLNAALISTLVICFSVSTSWRCCYLSLVSSFFLSLHSVRSLPFDKNHDISLKISLLSYICFLFCLHAHIVCTSYSISFCHLYCLLYCLQCCPLLCKFAAVFHVGFPCWFITLSVLIACHYMISLFEELMIYTIPVFACFIYGFLFTYVHE